MKDYIIIGLLVVIAMLILFRNVSGMTPAPAPAPGPSPAAVPPNCARKKIKKDLNCADIYPGVYEKDGTISGDRKFCCA